MRRQATASECHFYAKGAANTRWLGRPGRPPLSKTNASDGGAAGILWYPDPENG